MYFQNDDLQLSHSVSQVQTETALEVLYFKIYTKASNNHSEGILQFDNNALRKKAKIGRPAAIYIDHEHALSKIHYNDDDASNQWPKKDTDGYTLLLEVYPKHEGPNCKSFAIAQSTPTSYASDKELLRPTFIALTSKSQSPKKLKLKGGDLIKFGRENYLVHMGPNLGHNWYDKVYHQKEVPKESCRICLTDQSYLAFDYLITPCKCKTPVHVECLRTWMTNELKWKKVEGVKVISYKKHKCEVCKSPLPKYISFHGHMIELQSFERSHKILTLQKIDFQDNERLFLCIDVSLVANKALKIGRNIENDILMTDMSISRFHARLVISENGVEIEDCNSKFGTFVTLKGMESDLKGVSIVNDGLSFELCISSE